MVSKEIRKKINQIEISTRRLLSGSLVGDSRSAIKGSGFEFDQIREYQMGDDVRFIDWNSSSRMNNLLVKQYIQERNRTVIIAVDISASTLFSSGDHLKSEVIAHIGSVLSLVADYGKDAVSLLLFSDEIELCIPAGRGLQHTRLIMEQLFSYRAKKTGTRVAAVLDQLVQHPRSDSIVFLISDFIDTRVDDDKKMLSLVAQKYDCIAIRCLDANERSLPSVGFITVRDPETGSEVVLDLRARSTKKITGFLDERLKKQEQLFKKSGISLLDIAIDRPFVGDLIRFFRRRMSY